MGLFSRKGKDDADRDLAEAVGSGTSQGDDDLVTDGHTGRPVSRRLDEQERARIEAGVQRLVDLGIDVDDLDAIGAAYDAALAASRADSSSGGGPDTIVDTFAIAIGEHLARHSARDWAVVTDVFGTDLGLVAAQRGHGHRAAQPRRCPLDARRDGLGPAGRLAPGGSAAASTLTGPRLRRWTPRATRSTRGAGASWSRTSRPTSPGGCRTATISASTGCSRRSGRGASRPQHDELLFIIQHQTSELWLKLLIHELRSARALVRSDDLAPALKRLARVKHIQHTLTDQWSVLATMTPSEYAQIRPFLATSSGFQSAQYREVEFLLGNKNADMVAVFAHDEGARTRLETLLHERSLYDEFLAYLSRRGYAVPTALLERDWALPYRHDDGLVDVFAAVYASPAEHWGVYETCEELVDLEDNFQQWRFRHLQVVQRTIGQQQGTGGSSGVDFLRRALDLTFFPELYDVRSRVGG